MSKKDYELIAEGIKTVNHMIINRKNATVDFKGILLAPVGMVAIELAYRLALENNKFDKERFLTACGINL